VRRLALVLSVALLGGCSFFHDSLPGTECQVPADCFRGIERCDTVTHVCVPIVDAGPTPDAPVDAEPADAGPDADDSDAGPDADVDAAVDGGMPDAS
jgi:hypothetical protein